MLQGYLTIIWRWMSTVLLKMLAVWCIVTLLAVVWARLQRLRPDTVRFPSPRHEALLSLVVMLVLFALLFPLNRVVDAATPSSLLARFALGTASQLLMCLPVLAALFVGRQGPQTVGLSGRNLPAQLVVLGVALALVTGLRGTCQHSWGSTTGSPCSCSSSPCLFSGCCWAWSATARRALSRRPCVMPPMISPTRCGRCQSKQGGRETKHG